MLSTRLVKVIEEHADEIIHKILEEVRKDRLLPRFRQLPDSLLQSRFGNVCKNLGRWLEESDDLMLARRYQPLGRERYEEGIPLHEVVHATHIFKRRLNDYAREHCCEQTAFDLYAEGELERLLNAFFDRIVYHIVRGYEATLLETLRNQQPRTSPRVPVR